MLDAILELYDSGGINALLEGAGEITSEAASSIRKFSWDLYETLKQIKQIPSLTDIYQAGKTAGKAVCALLDPYMEELATKVVFTNAPLAVSEIVILLANLIGTSDSRINTPEMACKMENLLQEYMRRAVDKRLDQIEWPKESFGGGATYIVEKLKVLNKPYNKNGYNPSKQLRCEVKNHSPQCFFDKFKRKGNKRICTSESICYDDYVGKVRHEMEEAFPIEIFEKTCKDLAAQEQKDGTN